MGVKKAARVSKIDWLNAGMSKLKTHGFENIRVEELAGSLGVAKSGFYWHFLDRNDYLGQLVEHWDHMSNEFVELKLKALRGPPEQRLYEIMRLVDSADLPAYEIALQAWAREDERVRATVDNGIRKRERIVRSIIEEAGFKDGDLEMRAMLFVTYVSNEKNYFEFKSKKTRERLRMPFITLLLEK
jgi:AcrR family transcriptional regulator